MRASIELKDKFAFQRACNYVIAATKRDGADVINRALRNVSLTAAKHTPAANPANIDAELRKNKLALKIAAKRLGKRASAKEIQNFAKRLIAKRKAGARVMRVGWFKPAKDIGGSAGAYRPGGIASRGYGQRATAGQLAGEVANASYSGLKGTAQGQTGAVMRAALKLAVRQITAEQVAYAQRKMRATMKGIFRV